MGIGGQELLVILVIIVLLFGAKKIPELAKGLGKGIKSFKEEMRNDEVADSSESETKKVEPTQSATPNTHHTTTQA